MNRYTKVRELVKDPSLRVTEIAWKTGYNKGHVSRLRKEFLRQALCNEVPPADVPEYERGFVDGMQRQMQLHVNRVIKEGPTAWQCQCGKAYTVTCISSKPSKREWVSLTDEEVSDAIDDVLEGGGWLDVSRALEAKIKEKNHG